jgi:hypothetical protein
MPARAKFTQASVRRAIAAAHRSELRVVGVRSDGTVIVDDGDKPHPLVPTPAHNGQASVASRWEDVEA